MTEQRIEITLQMPAWLWRLVWLTGYLRWTVKVDGTRLIPTDVMRMSDGVEATFIHARNPIEEEE